MPSADRAANWPGALAVLFYATHGAVLVAEGQPEHLLWLCHVASLLVGAGVLMRRALLNAVGLLWLALGVPLWLVGLSGGMSLIVTSPLTHLGGLAVGLYGAKRLGMPRYAAVAAWLGTAVLYALSCWLTPPASNVNLSAAIWPGWEGVYGSYLAFALVLAAGSGLVYLVAELALRRLAPRQSSSAGRSPAVQ